MKKISLYSLKSPVIKPLKKEEPTITTKTKKEKYIDNLYTKSYITSYFL